MVGSQRTQPSGIPRVEPEQAGRNLRFVPPTRAILYGVGLLGVAVLAAFLWWLIRHDDVTAGEAQAASGTPATEFSYAKTAGPLNSTDCAAGSYGKVRTWFADQHCQQLQRTLHIAELGGTRALVSVAVVTMPSPEQAQQLKAITDTDSTGNITDLASDGSVNLPGAPKVNEGAYAASVAGNRVTITETNFYDSHRDRGLLQRIATDALKLGSAIG